MCFEKEFTGLYIETTIRVEGLNWYSQYLLIYLSNVFWDSLFSSRVTLVINVYAWEGAVDECCLRIKINRFRNSISLSQRDFSSIIHSDAKISNIQSFFTCSTFCTLTFLTLKCYILFVTCHDIQDAFEIYITQNFSYSLGELKRNFIGNITKACYDIFIKNHNQI